VGNHRTGMESPVRLLEEILSDYPRIWEFYKQNDGEKARAPKYAQRYPVPIGTLSLIIDFHDWVHQSSKLISDSAKIELSNHVKKTEVGPCPVVMFRVKWISNHWHILKQRNKSLSETLGDEVTNWHTRIRVRVNDGDTYTYQTEMLCIQCVHRSVVRINDTFLCVNTACRNVMTGEWLKWQTN
jgi:hypothetical protein